MDIVTERAKRDPNFASVCSFIELFAEHLGITITFPAILRGITHLIATANVDSAAAPTYANNCSSNNPTNKNWVALHIRLLKRLKYHVKEDRWERSLTKFCATYSDADAIEVEQLGYVGVSASLRLRILKNLLENQFDRNVKFKEIVNSDSLQRLRRSPLGRDMRGNAYWFLMDTDFNFMVCSCTLIACSN